MTYELSDALADELALLRKMLERHDAKFPEKGLEGMATREAFIFQIDSLSRILQRYTEGKEFILVGGYGIKTKQTTKHLVREYPKVKEAKLALDAAVAEAVIMEKLKS